MTKKERSEAARKAWDTRKGKKPRRDEKGRFIKKEGMQAKS
jgi:hypothetical protein